MSSRHRIAFWTSVVAALAVPGVTFGQFPQGFENGGPVVALPAGWVTLNVSPGGPGTNPDWQVRNDGAVFPAHAGAGYAFANYNSSTGTNAISNYMMSPEVTLQNGAIIRFWTRTGTGSAFPDRLILTYSTNGASTAPADFANQPANVTFHNLVDINPTLAVGGYPEVWTQYVSPPISGLSGPTQGRFAFWYYVQTDAGPAGNNSNYIGVDDVEFIPPGVTTGACCAGDGTCSATTPAACTGAGNIFNGLASDCAAVSCTGRCCDPDGFCQDLGPTACTALGGIPSAVGTVCIPQDTGCVGRCCMPDGSCFESGPLQCTTGGGTFGGITTTCGDGSQCVGRCCLANNTCTPNSSPTSCSQAGGILTLGANCQSFDVVTFTTPLAIQDGVGTGVGPVSSQIQTVAGISGNITDLNMDVKVDHSWMGDVIVEVEHLGVIVLVIDQMGQTGATCGGCDFNNIDVILDDEGSGGAIENQCLLATAAATSPPFFTPANPLSAFDGLNPNGAWTIRVSDSCAGDSGTLVRWSLHFANGVSPCAPACTCRGDVNGSGSINGADINKFAACVVSGGGTGCQCADASNGGGVTAADIAPFVNALIAGNTCVP